MTVPTWLKDTSVWLKGLIATFIGGAAITCSQWIGLATARGFGFTVPDLNWKSLGIMMLISGIGAAAAYLMKSPFPGVSTETTTVTQTKTVEKTKEEA